MKFVTQDWIKRSAIIMLVSVFFSIFLWSVELTQWAGLINANSPEPHGEPKAIGLLVIAISFLKITILTLVPALICYGITRVINALKRYVKVARTA
ncbi:hypothetical protein L2735_03255 [Shewanella olleyana]|uniref:hypothetical protein n=1 Tax=Shewanella olleyana TaxID=135626 RepID=UPI00200C530B|nr:hypothetical protein [Shewanella olleyana]MCL1065823.1 hypothetical protein [Shewanella olleyana]